MWNHTHADLQNPFQGTSTSLTRSHKRTHISVRSSDGARAYGGLPIAPQISSESAPKGPKLKSANQVLRDVHQILMYERERNRANLGNTLFGTNEVFAPMRDLKRELSSMYGSM